MKNFIRKVMSDNCLLLKYEEINKHPIGLKIEICPGFNTERLPTVNKVIFFRVELKKGVTVPPGWHDCKEDVTLYSGEVEETQTKTKLRSFINLKINKFQKHGFKALKDSVFYAYLYK